LSLCLTWLSTTPWRSMVACMYRPTFSWPRYYLGASGQLHALASVPTEKEPPVSIGHEFGWTPKPLWTTWRRENSWPYRDSNSDPSVVQLVANRCIEYAIRDRQEMSHIDGVEPLVPLPQSSLITTTTTTTIIMIIIQRIWSTGFQVSTVQDLTIDEAVFSVDLTDAPIDWLDGDHVICVYCRFMSVPRLYK
jgi:hypothetical protein